MPSVEAGMRTLEEIHDEIERLSEDRTELWHRLSDQHDPAVRAESEAGEAGNGAYRDRTGDLLVANQVLSQLS